MMQPLLWLSHLVQGMLWSCEESMGWCTCIVSFIEAWGSALFLKGLSFFKVDGCFYGVTISKAMPSGYFWFCSWSWWSGSTFSAADQQESFKERKWMVGTLHEIVQICKLIGPAMKSEVDQGKWTFLYITIKSMGWKFQEQRSIWVVKG